MVSIGSIFGLLLAGAVAIGGYALYQNRNALGGALARGVEVNVSNPLGEWFNSLFTNNGNNGEGEPVNPPPTEPPINPPDPNNDFIPCSNNPADYRTWCNGYVPPDDQDFRPPPNRPPTAPEPDVAPEPPAPNPPPYAPEPDVAPEPPAPAPAPPTAPNLPPGYDPNKIYNFDNPTFDPGFSIPGRQYYYIDFIGNIPDQQVIENEAGIELYEAPNVRAIYPLGVSRPLSDAAFRVFGESKGAYGV